MDTLKGFAEKRLRPKHEEDFVDRANFVTTPFMLATAAMLIFAKAYIFTKSVHFTHFLPLFRSMGHFRSQFTAGPRRSGPTTGCNTRTTIGGFLGILHFKNGNCFFSFVESTYYVPMNQSIPLRGERNNGSDRVSYYQVGAYLPDKIVLFLLNFQWIPFILVLMAIVCQLPTHLWRMCNSLSGWSHF